MSAARDIAPRKDSSALNRTVSNSLTLSMSGLSTSPTLTFHSPQSSFSGFSAAARQAAVKQLKPFNTKDIKVLLLENVNQTGRDILQEQGYQVEFIKSSLPEDQLIEKIRFGHLTLFLTKNDITDLSTVMFTSLAFAPRQS
jgi:D-3-phosphoglycerate dehydrogenase / 2-oxoglutarate reductase